MELLISDLPVSVRIKNALIKNGITNIEQFQEKTLKEISSIKGLGKDSLTELMFFLKNANIKLRKEEKVKKETSPLFAQAKEVVVELMKGRSFNWKDEIGFAKRLIQVYGFEVMMRVEIPAHVTSLRWLVSGIGAWAEKYIDEYKPKFQSEEQFPVFESKHIELQVEEKEEIKFEKPKTLRDFLNARPK